MDPRGKLGVALLDLGKSVSCHHQQIGQPVVVEIHHAGAPANEAILDRQAGPRAHLFKVGLARIPIQIRRVALEICFENIKPSIEIIITRRHAHSRLFLAIFAVCHAAYRPFFAEGSVMIVHEEKARSGIASHINIRPAIVVKISGNSGESVAVFGCRDSRRNANVDKSSISFIPVETVLAVRKPARAAGYRHSHPAAVRRLAGLRGAF